MKVCIVGAGSIGLGILRYMLDAHDPDVVIFNPPQEVPAVDELVVREATPFDPWFGMVTEMMHQEDLAALASQVILPVRIRCVEPDAHRFPPARFNGYMKRTHRRRM